MSPVSFFSGPRNKVAVRRHFSLPPARLQAPRRGRRGRTVIHHKYHNPQASSDNHGLRTAHRVQAGPGQPVRVRRRRGCLRLPSPGLQSGSGTTRGSLRRRSSGSDDGEGIRSGSATQGNREDHAQVPDQTRSRRQQEAGEQQEVRV